MRPIVRSAVMSVLAVGLFLGCGGSDKPDRDDRETDSTGLPLPGKACSTDCEGRSNCGPTEACDGVRETCPCQGNCVASNTPDGTLGKSCMEPCAATDDDGCASGQECTVTAPCFTCPCEGTCTLP